MLGYELANVERFRCRMDEWCEGIVDRRKWEGGGKGRRRGRHCRCYCSSRVGSIQVPLELLTPRLVHAPPPPLAVVEPLQYPAKNPNPASNTSGTPVSNLRINRGPQFLAKMSELDPTVAKVLDKERPDVKDDDENEDELLDELENDEAALDAFREKRMQQLHDEYEPIELFPTTQNADSVAG